VADQRRLARFIHLPASPARRALFLGLYLLFCLGLLALAQSLYWRIRAGVPLGQKPDVWDHFYPELRSGGLREARLEPGDGSFDLLLLGGSVLERYWGSIEQRLAERLEGQLPGRFRLFNLARSAFTSRDSLLLYRQLEGKHFDLVVVYDGINDARMNCCPPQAFRDDYTHCNWYKSIEARARAGTVTLPQIVADQVAMVSEAIDWGAPDGALREYAAEPQSDRALRANHAELLALARRRGDTLLLLTFACHLPQDYSRERFEAGQLDYAYLPDGRSCGAELWGKPEYVRRAVDLQNAQIRLLAEQNPRALFFDQDRALPKGATWFVDPCHLTDEGCRRFAENVWPLIRAQIEAWGKRPHAP
jgi:hypothetical protein